MQSWERKATYEGVTIGIAIAVIVIAIALLRS